MKTWEDRVREYEDQGMTRSDAQAVVDAEDAKPTLGYCKTLRHWEQHERGPECKEWQTKPHTEDLNTCPHGFIRASCTQCKSAN